MDFRTICMPWDGSIAEDLTEVTRQEGSTGRTIGLPSCRRSGGRDRGRGRPEVPDLSAIAEDPQNTRCHKADRPEADLQRVRGEVLLADDPEHHQQPAESGSLPMFSRITAVTRAEDRRHGAGLPNPRPASDPVIFCPEDS